MNQDVKAKWLEALRSGEYEQGQGNLHSLDGQFCCLGVLCDVAVKEGVIDIPIPSPGFDSVYAYEGYCTAAPGARVSEWAGLEGLGDFVRDGMVTTLAFINDDGASFEEIADIIESEF